jgi:AraC-like DNA-binding protein
VSRFHLVRAFANATGMAPYEYLIALRVGHAAALLASGWNCTDAATAAGFFDQSHLNRHFTRSLGVTPGAWARTG